MHKYIIKEFLSNVIPSLLKLPTSTFSICFNSKRITKIVAISNIDCAINKNLAILSFVITFDYFLVSKKLLINFHKIFVILNYCHLINVINATEFAEITVFVSLYIGKVSLQTSLETSLHFFYHQNICNIKL